MGCDYPAFQPHYTVPRRKDLLKLRLSGMTPIRKLGIYNMAVVFQSIMTTSDTGAICIHGIPLWHEFM